MSTAAGTCPAPTIGAVSSIFTQTTSIFLAATCIYEPWPQNAEVADGDWVDYIVIGSGPAGSVVASRLSEDENVKVLLIEAGEDPPMESSIPGLAERVSNSDKYNFDYTPTGGNVGKGLANKKISRSKILGGSSSSNNMAYLKGVENDYRRWYEAGNKEWHPDQVKKYFKKAEDLQDATLLSDPFASETYGIGGPLAINKFNSTKARTVKNVLSAYEEIGIKSVPDLNTANLMGSGTFPALVKNGRRVSVPLSYWKPNLLLAKSMTATKILMDKDSKLAYGVEAIQNGQKVTFYANNEIIISAGAIYTPMLLMLSGIGPEKVLLSNKIDYIASSPGVGQNLLMQTVVPFPIFADMPEKTTELDNAFSKLRYFYDRSGSLADLITTDVSAFYARDTQATHPDYQNLLGVYNVNSTDSFSELDMFIPATADALKAQTAEKALFLFKVVNLRPRSRGSVALKSNKYQDPPIIHPNYFKDAKDIENMVAGMQLMAKIVDTKYFKSINAKIARIPYKDCDKFEVGSTDYFKCIATNFATAAGNPMGTSRMGTDNKAVVDSRLSVRGVTGLRIVDESVMPTAPSCISDAPTIMLAELAADLIKEDNNGDSSSIDDMKMVKKAKAQAASSH